MKDKTRKIWLTVIYSWFIVIGVFCFLIDFIMSVTNPHPGEDMSWGWSLDNQFQYISVWITWVVVFWALFNFIGLYGKIWKWVKSKNNFTFVVSMSTLMFFVYWVGFAASGVTGVNTWYKVLKTILEHALNPILLLTTYFIFNREISSTNKYAKTDAFYVMVFITAWIVYVVVREAILRGNNIKLPDGMRLPNGKHFYFPYPNVDPWISPTYFWIPALLAFEFVPYAIETAFNALSNSSARAWEKARRKSKKNK